MKFNEFLEKNKISLSEPLIVLCIEGLNLMKKSVDPLHKEDHIERILDSLNSLLRYNPAIKKNINFNILLPAICWHDTWRSKKFRIKKSTFLYATFYDGLGSAKLFRKKAIELINDEKLIRQIVYTIRKHSAIQFLPHRTITARILKELDLLDEWSMERLNTFEKTYLKSQLLSPRTIRVAKFYFDHYMIKSHQSSFYFPWTQDEFKFRKENYISRVQKLAEEYTK